MMETWGWKLWDSVVIYSFFARNEICLELLNVLLVLLSQILRPVTTSIKDEEFCVIKQK